MRTKMFAIGLLMHSPFLGAAAYQADKAAHFGLTGLGTASTIRILQLNDPQKKVTCENRVLSSLVWSVIGVAKEWHDRRNGGKFDSGDLAADGLGVLYGNLLFIEF